MIHVLSLGAGVQSTTMALMAAHGEIKPMPDCAIFADTGWEPRAVYEHLRWLMSPNVLPYPVHVVSRGHIRRDQIESRQKGGHSGGANRFAALPYYTKGEGETREGRVKRQCTAEYKIEPIEEFIKRKLLGLKPRQRAPREVVVTQWRGISTDEASRMKPSRLKWMTVRYPLAMEERMSRQDCLAWMFRKGYPQPPRSACIGCPFHSDAEWRNMRDNRQDEWEDAVAFDYAIRDTTALGMERPTYLHRQCVPLDKVDLDTPEDRGQVTLFGEECEGMCGL